jgi:hypothetical protein
MKTFNLTQVVNVPTFLSDHHAQVLILENIKIPLQKPAHKNKIRVTDDQTLATFQMLLKEQTWDTVYSADDVNRMFNNFTVSF